MLYNNRISKFETAKIYISFLCSTATIGQRIPSIKNIATLLNMSVGMVQKVIFEFEKNQIIVFKKKGMYGTFLEYKNPQKLYEINQLSPIFGTLPLPYTCRYEKLGRSIESALEKVLPCYLIYMRGAVARAQLIESKKADFGIMSKFSFSNIEHSKLRIIYDYGKHSYLKKHVIVTRVEDNLQRGMRIGIDQNSFDQTYLAKTLFPEKEFPLISINYHSLIKRLIRKEIDITILNYDEDRVKALNTIDIPLEKYPIDLTTAVLVARTDNEKSNLLYHIHRRKI